MEYVYFIAISAVLIAGFLYFYLKGQIPTELPIKDRDKYDRIISMLQEYYSGLPNADKAVRGITREYIKKGCIDKPLLQWFIWHDTKEGYIFWRDSNWGIAHRTSLALPELMQERWRKAKDGSGFYFVDECALLWDCSENAAYKTLCKLVDAGLAEVTKCKADGVIKNMYEVFS
jgi:hypothetical protein